MNTPTLLITHFRQHKHPCANIKMGQSFKFSSECVENEQRFEPLYLFSSPNCYTKVTLPIPFTYTVHYKCVYFDSRIVSIQTSIHIYALVFSLATVAIEMRCCLNEAVVLGLALETVKSFLKFAR